MAKIEKEVIREPYLFGEKYTLGDRHAEVIRCYPGEWATFYYQNGRMWCLGFETPNTDKQTSVKSAKEYLQHGTLPAHPDGKMQSLVSL